MKTLYVVMGVTGEYSDRSDWPVQAYRTEHEAQERIKALDAKAILLNLHTSNLKDRYNTTARAALLRVDDPNCEHVDYTGVSWHILEVPFEDEPS